jgi:HlyD family secretion protein
MDTLIERKKRFTPRQIYGGVGVLFILVLILYFIFRDTGSSMTIDKSRITIATVTENEFNDYIRVIGQVLPSRMIYLDAIEGGRVEERLHEEGAMVKKGDAILRLSNPLLISVSCKVKLIWPIRKTSCVIPVSVWSRNG